MPLIVVYTSPEAIKARLQQLDASATPADDALLETLSTDASIIVRTAIRNDLKTRKFDFGALTGERTAYGRYDQWLPLPVHEAGTVAAVADSAGVVVSALTYEEADDEHREGRLRRINVDPWAEDALIWAGRYTVTADFGYGPVPADIADLATDIAVDLWRRRDAGFYGEVGSADGAVKVMKALGKQLIISNFVEQYRRAARYE